MTLPSLTIALALALGGAEYAIAQNLTVLHSFTDGADGGYPSGGLIADAAGNLYGATAYGGGNGAGVVFVVTPNQDRTAWSYSIIYSFCPQANCIDGAEPYGNLAADGAGNLYGTAYSGGTHSSGVVFELAPNLTKTAWTYSVLYNFCSQSFCVDGNGPLGSLLIDETGNLYGTTAYGGAGSTVSNSGVVFELIPNQSKTSWTETVLYNFCSWPNCMDGEVPNGGLAMDAAGNLYGTTPSAGANGNGTVFELAPNPAKTEWTYSVLYDFCAQSDCKDGSAPNAGLAMDAAGSLYGATAYGGNQMVTDLRSSAFRTGGGVAFKLTPQAGQTSWTESVLYSFCSAITDDGSTHPWHCADGVSPSGGLIIDSGGNLYGTTSYGGMGSDLTGAGRAGAVFALTPNQGASIETLLYSFCSQTNCVDGREPLTGVVMDAAANLYGTTYLGGSDNAGVVYMLSPPTSRP